MSRTFLFLVPAMFILGACGGGNGQTGAATGQPAAAVENPVDPATAANITGTVRFTGTAPRVPRLNMAGDAFCRGHHDTDVLSEEVIINPNNTLKNVYVYVKSGLGDLQFPVPTEHAVLDQIGCIYTPHVMAVQANQPITIRNSDAVLHNVHAQATNNRGFNIGQPVKGMETVRSFPNPEVMIRMKCDVHPWMTSYIGIQNHPFAYVTDDQGSFSLQGLPPGEYEIEAWHEKFGTAVQKVTVGPSETQAIEFTFRGA